MEKKLKGLSPLAIVLSGSLIIAAVVIGAIIWTSPTHTFSLVVSGTLTAKTCNVEAVAQGMTFDDVVQTDVFYPYDSLWRIYIVGGATNGDETLASVLVTKPPGAIVTCTASLLTKTFPGSYLVIKEIGAIPVDGSTFTLHDTEPLWLFETNWGTNIHCLRLEFQFQKGTLPPGTHPIDVEVSLGF